MFTVQYAKNLQWANLEHTSFICDVKFLEMGNEVPFNCLQNEEYTHSKDLWERATAGEFGTIAEFVAPISTVNSTSTV